MGVPQNVDLAQIKPVSSGGSWIRDPEGNGNGELLRPDWKKAWKDNSGWHKSIVEFVRQKVPENSPAFPKVTMDAIPRGEILKRIRTVMKTITTKYRRWEKTVETGSNGVQEDLPHEKQPRVVNRRLRRKERVRSLKL